MQTPKLKVLTQNKNQENYLCDNPTCPFCGSSNVLGISRVVGYYSPINNWNLSKQAELEARQRGNYKL